ncbi:MAG: hypothetical protein QM657_04250 [Lacrimispora sp.]|uniref:hypothetical protein n=1 Tax=Lacrimispora sp. TaxID=2719234 RepID=UPI0039E2C185
MSLTTTILKGQANLAFRLLWRRLLLAAIVLPPGFIAITGGLNSSLPGEHGLIRLVNLLLVTITKKYPAAQKWLPLSFAAIFFIIGALCLFQAAKSAWQMMPRHTLLGISIVSQARDWESFSDILRSIDTDMDRGHHSFGGIFIGREWILGSEAMRLSRIRGMFSFDEDKKDNILVCIDDAGNDWSVTLPRREDRDKAEEYLKKILSNIVTGGILAFTAFLMDGLNRADMMALSPDTVFSLIKPDGIPTSNFTYEDARAALDSLSPSQTLALRPLNGGKTGTEEISFLCKEGRQWEITVICQEEDIQWPMIKLADEQEAIRILESLMKEKSFRTFSHGTGGS